MCPGKCLLYVGMVMWTLRKTYVSLRVYYLCNLLILCMILKDYAQKLAESKGMLKEYSLYDRVERIGTQLLSDRNMVGQTNLRKCGLLYRFYLYNAWYSGGVIYTDLCNFSYCRMECASSGRTCKSREDHSSGIQICWTSQTVC